ncbi:unnamed protein product [Caenorhabditis brenneri]
MVIPTAASPIALSNIKIGLKHRKTSSADSNVDLMNTAFFEPDIDPEAEAEMKRTYSKKGEPDAWEESIIELKKKYPILMCLVIPAVIQLLLLLLVVVFLKKTGISDAIDKFAANLYYYIFSFMFSK